MPELPRSTPDLDLLKAQLDQHGYVVLRNVFPESVQDLRQRLNRTYEELKARGQHTYPGGVGQTERLILNLHNKDPRFIDLLDDPRVFPLLRHLMQSGSYQNSEPFIVTQFSARDPHLGAPPQQLHIDSRFPGPPFALMAIALWMVNDFSLETGGTRLVPGSHRVPAYPENGLVYPNEVTIEAPAGSVLIYNGSSWHGGGAKLKEAERWSIIVSYCRWFVKPAFDMTRNTPPELYAQLSPARRELFGFTTVPPADEHVRARGRVAVEDLPPSLP
jgi:ectoine hydroxylase-related dioxygenase (phytanoyl-CoA dioxygenase family)